jgi:WD40 repeat protein
LLCGREVVLVSRLESLHLPYPGLRPFEACEADLFFGREEQVDGLLKRLSKSHFVAVVGESGAGKSSLVRAGLLPALEAGFVVEAGSDWRFAVMRPGSAPLAALADVLLAPHVLSEEGGVRGREFALAELRRGPLGLVQLVRDAHLAPHCNLLLVVDQFEELFRYCREPAQKDQANIFVELLLRATGQREVPILVVLTMRSDFIGDCARFRGLPERLNDNQFLTPRLTRDQIAAAIRGPARVCGGKVEDLLVHELCNAVGDDQDQLPLLQHLLMRLWERAREKSNPPCLTSELSNAMGGLHFALKDHAQQIYDALPSEDERAVARVLFKSLIDPHSQRRDVRRDAGVAEIAAVAATSIEPVIAVAEEFRAEGRHMLMPPAAIALDAGSRLDISHESLIRQWSSLNEWAGEETVNAREFERLREEARRERDGKGELLGGRDLVRAQDWIKHARPTPGWAERYAPAEELDATLAFISRSEEQEKQIKDEELRMIKREATAKRSRRYNWILGALLLIAAGLAGKSILLYQQAETDRTNAVAQKALADEYAGKMDSAARAAQAQWKRAEELAETVKNQNKDLLQKNSQYRSRYLADQTIGQLSKDPTLAVILARAALLEHGSDKWVVQALRKAIADHVPSVVPALPPVAKLKNYLPDTGKNSWLEFSLSPASLSPQGDLAIIPSGNDAIIWSTASGKTIRVLHAHENIVGTAHFSPNGRLAVTTSADETARLWDVSTGKPLQRLKHDAMVNAAVFNRDGQMLVTLGDDSRAKIWRVGADKADKPTCELKHAGEFIAASFSHDQSYLVTVTHQDFTWQAQVWNLADNSCPSEPVKVPILDDEKGVNKINLKWASFSDRGPWLGVVTVEGTAMVLSTADWTKQPDLTPDVLYTYRSDRWEDGREALRPPAIAWSSGFFAAAGGDNIVRVRAIEKAGRPVELRGHTGRVTSITFDPKGDMLLTTSEDRTARIWKLGTDKRPVESVVLRGHKDTVGSGVFSDNSDAVITASEDGTVRVWKTFFSLREKKIDEVPSIKAASFSADGKRMWVAGASKVVEVAATDSLKTLRTFAVSDGPWTALYAPAEAKVIATGSNMGIGVADMQEPSKLFFLPESASLRIRSISPGGKFVAAESAKDRSIKVWDIAAPQAAPWVSSAALVDKRECSAVGISGDGLRLGWYCAEQDKVLITRMGRQERITTDIKNKKRVASMRFSKNGRKLAVAFDDYSVQVLDSDTGRIDSTMLGHTRAIEGIDFSHDDRYLATIGADDTARVWEVESGEEVALTKLPDRWFTAVNFSRDGLSLLLQSTNSVLLWRCYACGDTTALLEEVQRRNILRPLSKDEQQRFGLSSDAVAAAETR